MTRGDIAHKPPTDVAEWHQHERNRALHFIARLALAAPRTVLAVAALLVIGAGVFGVQVTKSLSAAGFRDPSAESSQVADLMSAKFGQGDLQLVFAVDSPGGARSPAGRAAGLDIVDHVRAYPFVADVTSAWTAPPAAAAGLISKDGGTGLVLVGINGGGSQAQRHAKDLAQRFTGQRSGATVTAGGPAMTYVEINAQSERDLVMMELIAIPFTFLVLVGVFGGLLAAALPLTVGICAIVGSMAVLRLFAVVTEVSTFALNLTIAMGLALAVDYTLLIVSRFREERARGCEIDEALCTTMATAGRTVLFSALTVGLSMLALALFPMYFLRSFAFAGVAVVALTALAALVIGPAAIVVLGDHLDALDLRPLVRRLVRRPPPQRLEDGFWYRTARFAIRRAAAVAVAVTVLLLILGAPFTHVRWGFPDERMLPSSASARQLGDRLRTDFGYNPGTAMTVVVPDVSGVGTAEVARFARDFSLTPYVASVSAPTGTYVAGSLVGPPSAPAGIAGGGAFLTVTNTAPIISDDVPSPLDWMHSVVGPGGKPYLVGGLAQVTQDNATAISTRLPWVLMLIGAISFVLLFGLTGSLVLPVKAILLNTLSLTATFGALVWIFQDGALDALGTVATGSLVAQVPVLLFCVAFGLSMDYEVFLIARIREFWLASRRESSADNDDAIAMGLASTGRIVTAAALLMAISFSALMASQVSIMRMFGLGLTLAVVMDATLVRMLLVPAFMHLLGKRNWWAPDRLAEWHRRHQPSHTGFAKITPVGQPRH
ncbi:MMPL family transporter [Mycolicibacterium komossense]|uniref:MMPL family transporter n=1 Tax=Mycolicibacterium komossense TaxID=1779 RepID=A0ABT3CJI0_9MYCO|nr:MMPL family transporter [Mycolicibacterium komossense]MCV7229396.1 MMPL family transporter [Mycolicibacterium komossense]